MRILVSGTASGLGRHLKAKFGAVAYDRQADGAALRQAPFDAIIHCAFNPARDIPLASLPAYLDDNIGLTRRLLAIPHGTFVYLSTVDLYPNRGGPFLENQPIDAKDISGAYALCKATSEAHVQAEAKDFLILRPTSLLGRGARPSAPMRLLAGYDGPLGLSADSRYNLIRHQDVGDFIETCLIEGHRGIFNLASSGTICLGDMAARLGRRIEFGDHLYRAANIDAAKCRAISKAFERSSHEVLDLLASEMGAA